MVVTPAITLNFVKRVARSPLVIISATISSVLQCDIAEENVQKYENGLFILCCSPYTSGACGTSIRAYVPQL